MQVDGNSHNDFHSMEKMEKNMEKICTIYNASGNTHDSAVSVTLGVDDMECTLESSIKSVSYDHIPAALMIFLKRPLRMWHYC